MAAGLLHHLDAVRALHERDLTESAGWAPLPGALGRKLPNAGREWPWQFVFPAARHYADPVTRRRMRHHLHESAVQRAVREAVRRSGIPKRATCHTFRHSFATHPGAPAADVLGATRARLEPALRRARRHRVDSAGST